MGAAHIDQNCYRMDQNYYRIKIYQKSLYRFNHNIVDFVLRFITKDETWIQYYTLEIKQQTKIWRHSDYPAP